MRIVVVVLVVGALAILTIRPVRLAAQTAALVPEFMDAGPRPLQLVPAPRRESVGYGVAREDRLDLYLPHDAGPGRPRPAVVLVLGVHRVPLDHPAVVRVATAIARIGLVGAVPESAELRAGRLGPSEAAHLADAFAVVATRPEVERGRVGLAGFSAGGSLALLVASEPAVASDVAWVNAFGAYGDADMLLAEVATRRISVGGEMRPWQPGDLTRGVIRELLLATAASAAERTRLAAAIDPLLAKDRPPPGADPAVVGALSGDARAAYRLVVSETHAEALAAVASLSAETRSRLEALSPTTVAGRVRAPVFLMHDDGDDAIPISQLEGLAAAYREAGTLRRATTFQLFDHVQPAAGLGLEAIPELATLFDHVQALLDIAA